MTIDWKLCPAGCGEEFGKMVEMRWKTPAGEERIVEACPICAHTIRGFAFLANEIPIEGAHLVAIRKGLVKVAVGARHFFASDASNAIFATDSFGGDDSTARVPTSLGAWCWMKRRLAKVTTPDMKSAAAPKTPAGRSALLRRVLDGKKKAT